MKKRFYYIVSTGVLALLFWGQTLHAQGFQRTYRASVPSYQLLGMGGAGVAFPSTESPFFYNPAQLSLLPKRRTHLSVIGLRGAVSKSIFDQYSFYNDRISPVLDEGFDQQTNQELVQLFDDALAVTSATSTLGIGMVLPAYMKNFGAFGLGVGVFSDTKASYRLQDGGINPPNLDLRVFTDVIGAVSFSVDLARTTPINGSVGLSAKYGIRYATLKNKPLDTLDESEAIYVFSGNNFSVDLGVFYEVMPRLTVGLAVYDLIGDGYTYSFDTSYGGTTFRDAERDRTLGQLNALGLVSSYRIGAAYMFDNLAFLKNVGVALDYVGYGDAPETAGMSFFTHLHMGAQAQIGSVLRFRAGLNQGYPTAGLGIDGGKIRLDYVVYGVEDGRLAGQSGRWVHAFQLALGMF